MNKSNIFGEDLRAKVFEYHINRNWNGKFDILDISRDHFNTSQDPDFNAQIIHS